MSKAIGDSLVDYSVTDFLGAGAYGSVFAAREISTGNNVAIKSCKSVLSSRTLAKRTLRELRLLRHCSHPNVVQLYGILPPNDPEEFSELNFVFELMDTDLAQVIRSNQKLVIEHIQFFGMQLLSALDYLHRGSVIHRDVKPRNILVNADCTLKLADFGLAKVFKDGVDHCGANITDYVTTRWYRAPEVLSGWTTYGSSIDMWAVGCILAELFLRVPLFPGSDSAKQLDLIATTLGIPDTTFLRMCKKGSRKQLVRLMDVAPSRSMLRARLQRIGSDAFEIISKLLVFDPTKRPSASECLQHRFFGYTEGEKLAIQVPKEAFVHEEGDVTIDSLRDQLLFEVNMYKPDENNLLEDDSVGSKLTVMDETIKITVSESSSSVSPVHTYEHSALGSGEVEEFKDAVDSVIGEVVVGEVELAAVSKTPASAAELAMAENAKEEAMLTASKASVERFSPLAKTMPLRKVIRERTERNLSRDTFVEAFVPPPPSVEKEDIPLPSAVITKKMLSPVTTKRLNHIKPEYKMITTVASASTFTEGENRPLNFDYEPSTLRPAAVDPLAAHQVVFTSSGSLSQKKREGDGETHVCGTSLPFGFCNSQEDESPTITAVVAREKEKRLLKTASCIIA